MSIVFAELVPSAAPNTAKCSAFQNEKQDQYRLALSQRDDVEARVVVEIGNQRCALISDLTDVEAKQLRTGQAVVSKHTGSGGH